MKRPPADKAQIPYLSADETRRSVVITDPTQPDNPVVHANEEFYRVTGYTPKDVLGRNWYFLTGSGTDPKAAAALQKAVAEGLPLTVDILNYKKSGTPFWNRVRLRPVRRTDGTLVHFVSGQNPIRADEVTRRAVFEYLD